MISLSSATLIGKGNERACYLHPEDADKAIKVTLQNKAKRSKQTKTEIKYYKKLLKKGLNDWSHLPKFYGEIQTDKGKGFIVEIVKDYDGEVSKSFAHYMNKEGFHKYQKELNDLKEYFLNHCIIFNYGMMPKNLLLRKKSESENELVLIDGLGDVSHLTVQNILPYFARQRIKRRWKKFEKKYLIEGKRVAES
jgi:hypothetical protein